MNIFNFDIVNKNKMLAALTAGLVLFSVMALASAMLEESPRNVIYGVIFGLASLVPARGLYELLRKRNTTLG